MELSETAVMTALGAEATVPWEHAWDALPLVEGIRARGYEIAAVETSVHAVDLFDWQPRFPVCVVFGHDHNTPRVSRRWRDQVGHTFCCNVGQRLDGPLHFAVIEATFPSSRTSLPVSLSRQTTQEPL